MRKFFSLLLLATSLSGCATITLPNYVPDKNPYKRRFAYDFTTTVEATKIALNKTGFSIKEEADPGLYERGWQINDADTQHVLIFTDYAKSYYIVKTKNVVMNAYIRSNVNGATEVELRYLNVSTIPFKNFYNYKNNKLINKIYKKIEEDLQSK